MGRGVILKSYTKKNIPAGAMFPCHLVNTTMSAFCVQEA
jgi:hypothetical protein